MRIFQVRNVHQALPDALRALKLYGYQSDSRNGPVLRFDGPTITAYDRPAERVLFWPERNANPFFHLFESLWMLAGRNDVASLTPYVARMIDYSDDGRTFHGAYGHRWRSHFHVDQLNEIINRLKADPTDRRQVLSMWDAWADFGRSGKDLPCNLQAVFSVGRNGQLDMMVTNRSNDLIWGAYGANAVHFSYLHEYVARSLDRPQGTYYQVSFNTHAYLNTLEPVESLAELSEQSAWSLAPRGSARWEGFCPYQDGLVEPFPLMRVSKDHWDEELKMFLEEPDALGFQEPFFRRVAQPVVRSWKTMKAQGKAPGRFEAARVVLADCQASDWKKACLEWLRRAELRARRAEDDGPASAV